MKDTLSIFITAIIFVLLIVIFPLYNYFERQDDMSYNLVLKTTTDFIDEVIYCGYISQEMYTDFASQLGNTGNAYDIQLEAHRKVLVKSDSVDQYEEQYLIDYNDDIFSSQVTNVTNVNDKVIKDGVYKLNVGDKIYIKLKNSSTTMAGALFNIIVPTSSPETIKINYGGIIQNNTWKQANTPLFEDFDIGVKFNLNASPDNNANYNSDDLKNGFAGKIHTGTTSYTYTIPNGVPTRTNCTFKHWNTESDGTGNKYNPGDKMKIDDNVVLYAIWDYKSINLTLNANGGTPATQTKNLIYGKTYTVLGITSTNPTRTGYEFEGWYTAASGGTKITSSTKVTSTNNVTLYAHWKLLNMTITLNANGGSVSPSSYTGTYKQKYGNLPTPTKTGYTFKGWYLESTLANKVTNDTIINNANNHTLYAKWEANSYTVTFNGNGGTSTSRTVSYNNSIGTLPTSSRTGYTFNGWYTATSGGTKISESTKVTSNVTYYAQWTIKTSVLTINPNGGSVSSTSITQSYGTTYNLSVTSYPNAYTVTFNGNGGTAGSSQLSSKRTTVTWSRSGGGSLTGNVFTFNETNATVTASYSGSSAITLPSASRTSPNYCTYSFAGWYTAASGGTRVGGNGSSYTPSSNVTLYAQWSTTYKTATVGNVTYYLNIHSQPNSYASTITGYVAKGTKVTVKGYEFQAGQPEGYYYVENIPDAQHGGTKNGWLAESNLIFN